MYQSEQFQQETMEQEGFAAVQETNSEDDRKQQFIRRLLDKYGDHAIKIMKEMEEETETGEEELQVGEVGEEKEIAMCNMLSLKEENALLYLFVFSIVVCTISWIYF